MPRNNLSWVSGEFRVDASHSIEGETTKHCYGFQKNPLTGNGIGERSSKGHWQNDCSHTSRYPSTPLLQESTTSQEFGLQENSFDSRIQLDENAKEELHWWITEVCHWNGKPINPPSPNMIIETDRGAVDRGGEETPHQLAGIARRCLCCEYLCQGQNQCLCAIENGQYHSNSVHESLGRNKVPKLSILCLSARQWCLRRGIILSVEHLPSVMNCMADKESQMFHSSVEWKLDSTVCQQIFQRLGSCHVDLFASRLNNQYISWRPYPYAIATDAFQTSWQDIQGYVFPPFSLIGKCRFNRRGHLWRWWLQFGQPNLGIQCS